MTFLNHGTFIVYEKLIHFHFFGFCHQKKHLVVQIRWKKRHAKDEDVGVLPVQEFALKSVLGHNCLEYQMPNDLGDSLFSITKKLPCCTIEVTLSQNSRKIRCIIELLQKRNDIFAN